jgi:holo-ACP synthase / triphosphoribosyl-dephospho-CoA synthase
MEVSEVTAISTADFHRLLEDREKRALKIRQVITLSRLPLVELTLNIPGPEKINPRLFLLHRYLEMRVHWLLQSHDVQVAAEEHEYPVLGPCALLSIRPLPGSEDCASNTFCQKVKRLMVSLEEDEPLGRLFDIDVFTSEGEKIQRSKGLRQCLLCDAPAAVCARSASHPIADLTARIEMLMRESAGLQRFVELPVLVAGPYGHREPIVFHRIALITQQALMAEVSLTPKPGLVDRDNSGAHRDMDFYTFSATTCALGDTFFAMVKAGYEADEVCRADLARLLPRLRLIGLEGEKTMFLASQGINTQKGLIFSLGLLLGALGLLLKDKGIPLHIIPSGPLCDAGDLLTIRGYVSGICKDLVARELSDKNMKPQTYGERLHQVSGVRGARGEAEAGFPTAFHAFDLLCTYINRQGTPYYQNFEKSALQTLLMVMVDLEDTNVLGRHGWPAMLTMRNLVRQYLKMGGVGNDSDLVGLRELDTQFIIHDISPGGAADALATAIFLYYLIKDEF